LNNSRKASLLTVMIFCLSVASTFVSRSQTLGPSTNSLSPRDIGLDALGRPAWASSPHTQLSVSDDKAPAILRLARAKYFDTPSRKALVPYSPGGRPPNDNTAFIDSMGVDPFPKSRSDLIAIGNVTATQPFLSFDKSSVYSELIFVPSKILVDKTGLTQSNHQVQILQRGGTLQLPNGMLLSSAPYGGSNPIPSGIRELLFLKYDQSLQAFRVIRAWNLSKSTPVLLDDDGHRFPYDSKVHGIDATTESRLVEGINAK
jgi:hypothetical protein